MPIYTKTGDKGTTAVFGGRRISKSDLQIEAYGSVDELSSFIGLIIAKLKDAQEISLLTSIQKSLYDVMSFLAGAPVDIKYLDKNTKKIEQEIDKIARRLPKLHRFILPQGTELTALYHVVRSVCRRCERNVVEYGHMSKEVIKYLNRLSDLFFTLARKHTKQEVVT